MWRFFLLLSLLPACGFRASEAPVIPPHVKVGTAQLSGRVVDLSDIPVPAMKVTCSESDAQVITGDDGRWALEVPADSSITLHVTAVDPLNVFKDSTFGPVSLSNRTVVENLDLLSVPGSTIGGLNGIASGDENRGVVALNVVSVTGRCSPDDATVVIGESTTARAVYNLPGTSQPDRNLLKMQPNTRPQAWLTGIAPGGYFSIALTKHGCEQLPYPVAFGKMSWLPGFRVQSKALTLSTVFIP